MYEKISIFQMFVIILDFAPKVCPDATKIGTAQKTARNLQSDSPDNCPNFVKHCESEHGDVCRKDGSPAFNKGWTCALG